MSVSRGPLDIDVMICRDTYPQPYDASYFHNVKHFHQKYITGSRWYYYTYFTENALTFSGSTPNGQVAGDIRFVEPEIGNDYAQYWSGSDWVTITSTYVFMTSQYNDYGVTLTGSDLSSWRQNVTYGGVTAIATNYMLIDDTPSFSLVGTINENSWTAFTGTTTNDVPTHYNFTDVYLYKLNNANLYHPTYADGAFSWTEVVLQYEITMVGVDDGATYTFGGQSNDTYWTIRTTPATDGEYYFIFNVPTSTTQLRLRYYGGNNWYTLTATQLSRMKQDYTRLKNMPSMQYSMGWNDGENHANQEYQSKLGIYYSMDIIETVFTKIGEILNIRIFGNIPLYVFFIIPMIMGVVYVVLKFVR